VRSLQAGQACGKTLQYAGYCNLPGEMHKTGPIRFGPRLDRERLVGLLEGTAQQPPWHPRQLLRAYKEELDTMVACLNEAMEWDCWVDDDYNLPSDDE
jgi:hypothetical protein